MSDENKKDVELKKLTKELLQKQIEESSKHIEYAQKQIATLTEQIQQQVGVANYANHLLKQFDIPVEVKPTEPKKTELEVK